MFEELQNFCFILFIIIVVVVVVCQPVKEGLDRFALGSIPFSPDAPRPYRRALCAP